MIKWISLVALLGVVASCNFSNNQVSNQLKNLDSQLEQHPEMVWDSLKKIDPGKLNSSQQAHYYLLNASASDKNYIHMESDSTLRISLEFYREHADHYNLARCQYYLGKYAQNKQQIKTAYELFKRAELSIKESKKGNPHLLGLIYYQLGLILKQQNNHNEAITFIDKSYDKLIETKDTITAVYALRLKSMLLISQKNYEQAQEKLFKCLDIISTSGSHSNEIIEAKGSTISVISYFYRNIDSLERALEYGQKALKLFSQEKKEIPSQYYWNIINVYNSLQQLDSTKYYCDKMIATAEKENNMINVSCGYKILSFIEEKQGNYKKACELKNYFNKLKDDINNSRNNNDVLELEKRYNNAENERLLLKAENNNLKAYAVITIIVFALLIIGFPFYHRHKQLKLKYNKLSESVKHNEWGFLVTKEFITENHIAYDELERILNREKSVKTISQELYNKFHEALIQQKANYSGRLFDRLTSFDGAFGTKFQQLFPDFSTDELLMASMIHHQWKLTDMTTIFHLSLDAIRKRKARLAHKISNRLKRDIDLDEYLTNL